MKHPFSRAMSSILIGFLFIAAASVHAAPASRNERAVDDSLTAAAANDNKALSNKVSQGVTLNMTESHESSMTARGAGGSKITAEDEQPLVDHIPVTVPVQLWVESGRVQQTWGYEQQWVLVIDRSYGFVAKSQGDQDRPLQPTKLTLDKTKWTETQLKDLDGCQAKFKNQEEMESVFEGIINDVKMTKKPTQKDGSGKDYVQKVLKYLAKRRYISKVPKLPKS